MNLTKLKPAGTKLGHEYWYDEHGTLFCDAIDQSNMVGGGAEEERNTLENPERLVRILQLSPGDPFVLDFGCGHGLFIEYLTDQGIRAWGYDKFYDKFSAKPAPESADVVTLIECVEHLASPFDEFQDMFNMLKPGGKLMIESSYADWTTIDAPYVNPEAGHNTIWSHDGLAMMCKHYGFIDGNQEFAHVGNRNVRIFVKP